VGGLVALQKEAGDPQGALQCSLQHAALCASLGLKNPLAATLIQQGQLLEDLGRPDDAVCALGSAEQILYELGDRAIASTTTLLQAGTLFRTGRRDEAVPYFQRAYDLNRTLEPGNHRSILFDAISQLALAYTNDAEPDKAITILQTGAGWMQELKEPGHCAWLLFKQAAILNGLARFVQAEQVFRRSLATLRSAGAADDPKLRVGILDGLGQSLRGQGRFEEALQQLREHDQLCRQVGLEARLGMSLNNQATMLGLLGKFSEALGVFQEQERVCRAAEDATLLFHALLGQMMMLVGLKRPAEALIICKKAEILCAQRGLRKERDQLTDMRKRFNL
jgi:tetratricopeptide (TPR) repeat protein